MIRAIILGLLLAVAVPAAAEAPRLERRGEAVQLIVDGKPFLILGGELGNSSSSNREWLAPRWSSLKAMHLNTVLAPVSWELIEPVEGRFDWSSVDWLVEDARANDMRLVILWFGTWKNSMSTYVPGWVKRDARRFPRTIGADGRSQEILSALSANNRNADARAFAALMAHLKVIDRDRHTVIMVQVENEVGFLPMAREGGASTDADADERFMASAYARYVGAVAAAGKRAYDLPMFANGAQGRPGKLPGEYPSGGPLAHLAQIWQREAPALDFIAPDIYFPNFAGIAEAYARTGNPLFVPEANNAGDPRAGANALGIIGRHNAFGFSPFSIDSADEAAAQRQASLYAMLASITPKVLEAQAKGRIAGFSNPVSFSGEVDESPIAATLGGVRFTATTIDPWTARAKQEPSEHGALLIWLGGDEYLLAGQGVTVTVEAEDAKVRVGFETVDEGRYVDGVWQAGRRLNGDQTHQGRHIRLPPGDYAVQRFTLYRYP